MKNVAVKEQVEKSGLRPVVFKKGLPGLDNSKKFTLHQLEGNPFFYFLHSADEPEVGLILLDPFLLFPDYSVELSEAEREELEVEKREDVFVFTTVTVLDRKRMTTNLAAPIVININKYLARQIIIPERAGETRTPLPEHEKANL